MPLKSGSSKKKISDNIKELIHTYKETGKIGNTTPNDMKHARSIASAIAYEKAGKKKSAKLESLETFILSLSDDNNSSLINDIIMEGFDICFNSLLLEDAIQTTTQPPKNNTDPNAPSTLSATLDPEKMTSTELDSVAVLAKKAADDKRKAEEANKSANTSEQQLQKVTLASSVNQ